MKNSSPRTNDLASSEDQDERIQAVLGEAEGEWEETGVWAKYLEAHLTFPFEAEVAEWRDRGPLQTGDRVRVWAIEDADDFYGVTVKCRHGRRVYYAALTDLAATNKSSANYQLVQDYSVWFANR